jgi:hypothetical protein
VTPGGGSQTAVEDRSQRCASHRGWRTPARTQVRQASIELRPSRAHGRPAWVPPWPSCIRMLVPCSATHATRSVTSPTCLPRSHLEPSPCSDSGGPLDSACAGSDWTQAVTIPSVQSFLNDRGDELSRHGLAFFDLEHGAYVLGRSLEGTLVDLARLDQACRLIEQGHTARASRPGPSN